MVELGPNVIPVGPWRCKHCGRELLLLTDTTPGPPVRGYVTCACGEERYGGASPVAVYWRTEDGNWAKVNQERAKADMLAG